MLLLASLSAPVAGCGDDGSKEQRIPNDAGTMGVPDAFYPVVKATDPCSVAGYFFDGESACDVVRCPEVTCECAAAQDGGVPVVVETITLSTCVPSAGCLSLVDCNRACDEGKRLNREACNARIAAAGAQRCSSADDCVVGACREESVGSICVDTLACGEDGHCGAGAACLFDPSQLDPITSLPTSLGTCADGKGGSRCYADKDCLFGMCSGQACSAGSEGSTCKLNSNCASGFCRITDPMEQTGVCVSGAKGGSCADDADCMDGLHCTSGVCYSDEIGQSCERDEQCADGICVASRCRGGEPGSTCEEDTDCKDDALCAGGRCATGELFSLCYEASDCQAGLMCARQTCSDGSKGMPCSMSSECTVLTCANGSCSDGSNGSECDSPDECTSARCADPAGVEIGECTSGAPGSVCAYDTNCVSQECTIYGVCE